MINIGFIQSKSNQDEDYIIDRLQKMCHRVRVLDHCEYVPNPLNTTLDYCQCSEEEIWWVLGCKTKQCGQRALPNILRHRNEINAKKCELVATVSWSHHRSDRIQTVIILVKWQVISFSGISMVGEHKTSWTKLHQQNSTLTITSSRYDRVDKVDVAVPCRKTSCQPKAVQKCETKTRQECVTVSVKLLCNMICFRIFFDQTKRPTSYLFQHK